MARAKLFQELTASEWHDEIAKGLDYRMVYGLESHWAELERMFYQVHNSMLVAGPNIIASTGDSLLANLIVPKPRFIVKPQREESVLSARVVTSVDNMLACKLKMRTPVQRAILSAYLWGVGILKIGYDSEWGFDPSYDVGGAHLPLGMTVTQMDRKGRAIEFGLAQPGMPWVDDVTPHDIVVPWGTKDLEHAPWVAHRVCRHIDDIRADVKYENTNDLMPSLSMADFVETYETGVKPYRGNRYERRSGAITSPSDDADFCELWEIHDRRTGKVYVIASGYDEFIRNEDDLLQVSGLPFVAIRFTPSARNFWVTPDAYYLKSAQAEMTDCALQGAKQRRFSSLRFGVAEDAIDPRELTKATSGDVGVCFKTKPGFNPKDVLVPFQPGQNFSLYQEEDHIRQNAGEIVGMGKNQQGQFEGSGRRTAREVVEVKGAANIRMGRRQVEMADAYVGAMEKINGMIFENWTAPRVAQILDPWDGVTWQQFTGPQLRGEYSYDVQFSAENTPSIEQQRGEAMQEYMAMSQDPRFDPMKAAQYLAAKYQDVDFASNFKTGVLNGQGIPMVSQPQGPDGVRPGGNGPAGGAGGGQAQRLALPQR